MKKLDLMGGRILRDLIEEYRAEESPESLYAVFKCLRNSEVWVPIHTLFTDIDELYVEDAVIQAKSMNTSPGFLKNEDEEVLFIAYSGLEQIKNLQTQQIVRKLIAFAYSLPLFLEK